MLGFIGAGKMAQAMAKGIVRSGMFISFVNSINLVIGDHFVLSVHFTLKCTKILASIEHVGRIINVLFVISTDYAAIYLWLKLANITIQMYQLGP